MVSDPEYRNRKFDEIVQRLYGIEMYLKDGIDKVEKAQETKEDEKETENTALYAGNKRKFDNFNGRGYGRGLGRGLGRGRG